MKGESQLTFTASSPSLYWGSGPSVDLSLQTSSSPSEDDSEEEASGDSLATFKT